MWGGELVLAGGDSVDDTVAMTHLLRPDVKIVTQKGHRSVDLVLTGFQKCRGEIIVMPGADGSSDGASLAVPL